MPQTPDEPPRAHPPRATPLRRVERAVERVAARAALWSPGDRLVVAVSGGADSLCLLGALQAAQALGGRHAPGELVVAHVEHGLRGAQGEDDATWVAQFAATQGLRAIVERVDTQALARAERRSLEDAARQARYAALRRIAAAIDAQVICVGHTRDDQAETLIMRYLRGAGLTGLSGMEPRERDIARPLLSVTRAETEAYCLARGWLPRHDASNDDPRFLRNRVRHQLLPLLETYNPNLRATLTRNATLLGEDDRYLEASVDAIWPRVIVHTDGASVAFARDELLALPLALRHRALRRAVWRLASIERGLAASHILALDTLLASGRSGARLRLSATLDAHLDYRALTIARRPPTPTTTDTDNTTPTDADTRDATHTLAVPGQLDLPALGWRLRAWLSDAPPGAEPPVGPPAPMLPSFTNAHVNAETGHAETRVYLDAAAAGAHLSVRAWRPGDRIRPLGMNTTKKVQDIFADTKTPRALRTRLPLIFHANGDLLWIAGVRLSDVAKLTPHTTRILILQMEPLP